MKKQGLIAGISLVIMAIAAGFSYGFVYGGIVVDDPVNTLTNLVEKRSLFTAGLAGWVVIFITDLVVTFSLFRFFSDTNRKL